MRRCDKSNKLTGNAVNRTVLLKCTMKYNLHWLEPFRLGMSDLNAPKNEGSNSANRTCIQHSIHYTQIWCLLHK